MVITGTLRWNDFENGFWSIELDEMHSQIGHQVVLTKLEPAADLKSGTRVSAEGTLDSETVTFTMAGPRFIIDTITPV